MDEISLQFLCMRRGSLLIPKCLGDVEVDFRNGCFVDSLPNREGGFHLARFLRQAHTTRVQNTVFRRIFVVASSFFSFSFLHPSLPSLPPPSSFLHPSSHSSCLQLPFPPPFPHRPPSPTDQTLSRSSSRTRTGSSTLPSPRSRSLPVPVSISLPETLLPPPLPRQSPQSQRRRRTTRRKRPPPPRNPPLPTKRVRFLPSLFSFSFYSTPPPFPLSRPRSFFFIFFRQSRSVHYQG